MKGKLDSQTESNDGSKYFWSKILQNSNLFVARTFLIQMLTNSIFPGGGKYTEVDATLAKIQKKLREGSVLETGRRGSNKVKK